MAFKRLYYNPAVHGGAADTYHDLHQGVSQPWMAIDLVSSFEYVVQGVSPSTTDYVCFGTTTDGAIFSCFGYNALNTGDFKSLPANPATDPHWRSPTTSEPWVVYTSALMTSGVLELYFQYHRK